MGEMIIFSGTAHLELAKSICSYLDMPLGGAKVTNFSDGEIQIEIDENVRARDIFIIQSTCDPVNKNLMELLLMIDCHEAVFGQKNYGGNSILWLCAPR